MVVNARVLGWADKCCGCGKDIQATEKVYIISDLLGVNGSIHLCNECINKTVEEQPKGIILKNIDLTGITVLEQLQKVKEEEAEFMVAIELADEENAIEELFDNMQVKLGLIEKIFKIKAEEVMARYPKHLEKLKNRPRKSKEE